MELKRTSWFVVLASLGALGGVVACSGGDESSPAASKPGEAAATLATQTEALSAEASDVVQVTPTQLIFPASFERLLSKQPGDILLGDRQRPGTLGKNSQGFLRKVSSVKRVGDSIVVETTTAALVEAFSKLSLDAHLQGPAFTAEGPVGERNEAGPGFVPQGGGKTIPVLNYNGKTLFNLDKSFDVKGKKVNLNAFAKVDQGYLNFSPSYDFGVDIDAGNAIGNLLQGKLPKLNGFHASATGALEAKLVLDVGAKTDTDITSEDFTNLVASALGAKSATLAEYPFDLGSIKAGPISVPINGGFKAVLDCDFDWKGQAEVKYGGQVNASITVGVRYADDKLSPEFSKSITPQQVGPDFTLDGLVKVKCSITPTFDLKLWDLGSAQIWAKAYAGVGGTLACKGGDSKAATVTGKAVAGASAGIKANLDLLGLVKFNKDCTLFNVSLDKSFTKDITLPGANATCTGNAAAELGLEPEPNPEACFGSGSGSGGSGGSGTGTGTGTNCHPEKPNLVDENWTCEAAKWNDCKCDCDCGAADPDCGLGECSKCEHDVCTAGTPLGTKCDECAQKVCEHSSYCCEEKWGPSCILEVEKYCGKTCDGN